MAENAVVEMKQLISFTVGEEEYGLELPRVREVIRMRQVTWLPKAPTSVKGIINLRGEIIPIIDLSERFGLGKRDSTSATRVIVVDVEGRPVGMVVDSASQVVRVPVDQFDEPPPVMGEAVSRFITSVGKLNERLVILLDVEKLFSLDELRELEASIKEADKHQAPVGGEA